MVVTVGTDQVSRSEGVPPFRKVNVSFWQDNAARSPAAKLLLLRVMVDGHMGACGTAPCVRARWAHDTGMTSAQVEKALAELTDAGAAYVDETAEEVWLPAFVALDRPKGGDDDFVNLNKGHRLVASATIRELITERYPGIDSTVERSCIGRPRAEAKAFKDLPRLYWVKQPPVQPGVQPGVQPPVQPKKEARRQKETLMPQDVRGYGPFSERGAAESLQSPQRAKVGSRVRTPSFDPDDEGVA
jgi:hypothetical protein